MTRTRIAMNLCGTAAQPQAGRSLVEMGLALVVLGILLVAGVSYWKSAQQAHRYNEDSTALSVTQQAMTAFAQARFRLPCPDTDGDGLENCTLADGSVTRVGQVPWRTVQLPAMGVQALRYAVERQPDADNALDRDLAAVKDRFRPLVAPSDSPAAVETLLGHANLLDLCIALHRSADAPATASTLIAVDGGVSPSANLGMAYVLASAGLLDADGNGSPFDGRNASATHASPSFETGQRSPDPGYDDRVIAVTPAALFADLHCAKGLSAIGHSHPNAALSAALMKRALNDLRFQLEVKAVLAGAGVASAIAGQAMAIAGLANAVAALANATTFTVITVGTAGGLIAAAVAAVVANTAATATAVGTLAASIAVTVEAAQRVARGNALADQSTVLAEGIDARMRLADQSGF